MVKDSTGNFKNKINLLLNSVLAIAILGVAIVPLNLIYEFILLEMGIGPIPLADEFFFYQIHLALVLSVTSIFLGIILKIKLKSSDRRFELIPILGVINTMFLLFIWWTFEVNVVLLILEFLYWLLGIK